LFVITKKTKLFFWAGLTPSQPPTNTFTKKWGYETEFFA